jgi:hypothetical protein
MRLLKYTGEDRAPYEWKPIGSSDLAQRRKRRRRLVAEGKVEWGARTYTRNMPTHAASGPDEVTMESSGPKEILAPRDTEKALVDHYRQWILTAPNLETSQQRITLFRAAAGEHFAHLTDGQVVEQLGRVADALAAADTERVYKRNDWDKPTDLTGDGIRSIAQKPEYDADEWKVPTGTSDPVDRRHKWQRSQDL